MFVVFLFLFLFWVSATGALPSFVVSLTFTPVPLRSNAGFRNPAQPRLRSPRFFAPFASRVLDAKTAEKPQRTQRLPIVAVSCVVHRPVISLSRLDAAQQCDATGAEKRCAADPINNYFTSPVTSSSAGFAGLSNFIFLPACLCISPGQFPVAFATLPVTSLLNCLYASWLC